MIRKAGCGVRPGLSKFKLRPRNGGNTRASSPTGGKNLLITNGSSVSTSPELDEAPAHQSFLILMKWFTRREGSQARARQFRSLSKIAREPNKSARKRKLPRWIAMADREESFSNGLIRQPLLLVPRRFLLWKARPKAQADFALFRQIRSRPQIDEYYSKQARNRKLPCLGMMADLEESFSNGHIRHLLRWKSRRGFWRARSKVLKVSAPIRYLWKDFLPSLASQIFLLLLQVQVWEGARRPRKLLLPGNRRGNISPLPDQKHRGREARSARIRLVQWRPPPSILWSHN